MDILPHLEKDPVLEILIPAPEYVSLTQDISRQLSTKRVCYVTLNKTAASLAESLKHNQVNLENIFFVDAISKTFTNNPPSSPLIAYADSPGNFDSLNKVLDMTLPQKFDFLIFDSVTNVLVYRDIPSTVQFLSSLVRRIREHSTKAVFFTLQIDKHQELIQESYMFMDRVVDMGHWSG
ncbi:MAG: hypothetical protein Q8P05_02085 [Candidatus Diapherotrites archaeon]|nr:hypothetical protein [Candidatus Diapherotrites archaeon]